MSQQDGHEAIRVVIEKLTEIVKESKEEVKSDGPNQDVDDESEEAIDVEHDSASDAALAVGPTFTIMEPDEGESQIEVVRTDEMVEADDGTSEKPDPSSTVEITVNVPPDLRKSLNTSDPRALLAALMRMDSNQVVVTQGPQETTTEQAPYHMVDNVGAEFIVMAAEPESSVEIQENVVEVLTTDPEKVGLHEHQTRSKTRGAVVKEKPGQLNEKKTLLKCSKCEYCSHNKHYLKQHVDLVHNADRPFKCPFCDYAGKRSHSLKEHLVVHSTNRPFICPVCNASFRKKGHLTNHVKLHNTLKYFDCASCQEKYTNKSQLYTHLRTAHNPNDVYGCNVCEYATLIKSNIIMHMHTHGNPEVYRCTVCSFTAVHINILRQHMQTHSEGQANLYKIETNTSTARPVILLKCSSCGYTTDNKDTLKSHMWKHLSKEKQTDGKTEAPEKQQDASKEENSEPKDSGLDQPSVYKCSECSYSCKQAYLFITHMLAHHPRQKLIADHQKQQRQIPDAGARSTLKKDTMPAFTHDSTAGMYRCTICGYMCEQQRTIKAHIWKHSGHKDIDYPMFQNGPISVYDDTPLGKSMLVSAEKSKPSIKIVPASDQEEPKNLKEAKEAAVKDEKNSMSTTLPNNSKPCPGITPSSISTREEKGTDPAVSKPMEINPVAGQTTTTVASSTISSKEEPPPPPPVQCHWVMDRETGTLRPVVPLPVKQPQGNTQPAVGHQPATLNPTTQKSSQASSFPAIVQLIMSPKQQSSDAQAIGTTDSKTIKRKASTDTKEDHEDSIEGVAKRICLEENRTEASAPKSSGNVVVQHVSQVYSTPTISIACNPSPSRPLDRIEYAKGANTTSPHLKKAATGALSDSLIQIETTRTQDPIGNTLKIIADENLEGTDTRGSSKGSVADQNESNSGEILRSLLKKGPNRNLVCAKRDKTAQKCVSENKAESTASDNESESSHSVEDSKKKGICSSLLAVIEQLREKSKSEIPGGKRILDYDSGKEGATSQSKQPAKKRSRRSSVEDEVPIEQYPNVEKLEKDQFRCKLCHYTSPSPSLIKTHMRLHKTFEPFECSLCDFHATSSEGLQDHMLQHCKVRVYHCKACTAEFNYKSQLRAHMRAHYEAEPFVCDMCDYETTNPISFRNHTWGHKKKKVEGPQSDTGDSSDSCTSQNVRTDNNQDLWCDQCIYVGKTSEDLIDHLQTEHSKIYKCEMCSQVFYSSVFLKDHMKFHDREKQKVRVELKKCELCDFTAISTRSLKSHMKRHINDQRFVQQPLEQYKCNLCGYVCHHLPSLKSHMWRHASNQNYSYQEINDLINAAIDYDSTRKTTKPDENTSLSQEETKRADTGRKPTSTAPKIPLVRPQGFKPEIRIESVESPDPVSISKKASLVTFRCCQCGFESAEKSVLNDHMKSHLDIIRKTLAVNKSQLVARAVKEMAQVVEKENEKLHENTTEKSSAQETD